MQRQLALLLCTTFCTYCQHSYLGLHPRLASSNLVHNFLSPLAIAFVEPIRNQFLTPLIEPHRLGASHGDDRYWHYQYMRGPSPQYHRPKVDLSMLENGADKLLVDRCEQ